MEESNNLRGRLHYIHIPYGVLHTYTIRCTPYVVAAAPPKTANFNAPKKELMVPLKYIYVAVVRATVRSTVSAAVM